MKSVVINMKKINLGISVIFLFVLISAVLFSVNVFAADTSAITLHYEIDSVPVQGIGTKLYKVADYNISEGFVLCGGFEDYSIDLNIPSDTENLDLLAETLSAYAISGEIEPVSEDISRDDGVVKFNEICRGMYLVVSDKGSFNSKICRFSPVLLISVNTESGELIGNDIPVYPKGEIVEPSFENITYKVIKLWRDNGSKYRPDSIEIAVSCNGKIISREVLSEENDWSYTWTVPDDGSEWIVTEVNIPEKYSVFVENRNRTFILTNTLSPEKDDPSPNLPSAPQTGDMDLMTFVLLTASMGVMMIFLGFVFLRRKKS